jgi:hypothetical protein
VVKITCVLENDTDFMYLYFKYVYIRIADNKLYKFIAHLSSGFIHHYSTYKKHLVFILIVILTFNQILVIPFLCSEKYLHNNNFIKLCVMVITGVAHIYFYYYITICRSGK